MHVGALHPALIDVELQPPEVFEVDSRPVEENPPVTAPPETKQGQRYAQKNGAQKADEPQQSSSRPPANPTPQRSPSELVPPVGIGSLPSPSQVVPIQNPQAPPEQLAGFATRPGSKSPDEAPSVSAGPVQQQPHSTHPEPSSQRPQRASSRKSPYDETSSSEEGIIRRPRKNRKVGPTGTSMNAQGEEGKRPAQSKAGNEVKAIVEMVQRLDCRRQVENY